MILVFAAEDDLQISFGQLKRFPWRELQKATNDFNESNVIGQGAFAKVYKGVLNDNTEIAVKRLNASPETGETSFLQEVEMISVAVHRNLLHLLGFCITPSERLLVYPYMPNKSVAYRLRGKYVLGYYLASIKQAIFYASFTSSKRLNCFRSEKWRTGT